MPRGDGTGPMGLGPMTGRGAGFCAGSGVPGFVGRGLGLGFGRGKGGRGGGRGWRNMFFATGLTGWQRAAMGWPALGGGGRNAPTAPVMTKEQEVEILKRQAEFLGNQIEAVKKRMEELSTY
ncbi:MAG: DUF5320 domain-containing protein [Thermoguttaceae bacterium]